MKKIGIDARLYSQTGVGTYLRNLIRELSLLEIHNIHFYLYVLPEDKKGLTLNPKRFTLREASCKWHTIEEQTNLLSIINQDKLDLMHFTYFGYPVFYRGKYIATIHDLTPLLFKTGKASTRNPLYYYMKYLIFRLVLNSQVKGASAIITPSETVKKQLVAMYGEGVGKKVVHIYEGIGYEFETGNENKSLKKNFPLPFFIYVGNFYPHKNIQRMVYAFAKTQSDHRLVLIGPQDYFSDSIARLIRKLGLEKRITFFHNATVTDLIFFYKNAKGLIHPSLSEGFGLPLVEAGYFNCPVIASDIPIMRELLGDDYISFNPQSVEDIRDTIDRFRVIKSASVRRKLLDRYSFQKMAESTLNLYMRY